VRLEVRPEARLTGDVLDALARTLIAAQTVIEQPRVEARDKALRRLGFRPGRRARSAKAAA